APDIENIPVVILPPLPPNLALTQTSECRHSNSRPDDSLSNFGSVRAILGRDDDGLRAGEKLKVLFHLVKSVGKALPPVLLTLGDPDSSHWVHPVIDTLTFGKREHRRKCHLNVFMRSVRQVVRERLVRGFDLPHEVFTVYASEVPDPTLTRSLM